MASFGPKLPSGTTIGTSMPSAKTEMRLLTLPGSKPAATRSLFLTRYQPGFVTISFAAGVAVTVHCWARRCAAAALGAGAVTPMPASVVKMPPREPTERSGSVVPPPVVVPALPLLGTTGPCIVWTPLMSTSST